MRISSSIAILMLVMVSFAGSQEVTSQDSPQDPSQHRLFFMPTARMMQKGLVALNTQEVVLFSGRYAMSNTVDIGFSLLPQVANPLSENQATYWSLGTRVQLVGEHRLLQGIVFGAEYVHTGDNRSVIKPLDDFDISIGSSPIPERLMEFTVATSLGGDQVTGHLAFTHMFSVSSNIRTAATSLQIGLEFLIVQTERGGFKLIGETSFDPSMDFYDLDRGSLTVLGIRYFTYHSILEFGWASWISDHIPIGKAGSLPYASIGLYF